MRERGGDASSDRTAAEPPAPPASVTREKPPPGRGYQGLIAAALESGCTRNPCREACPYKDREHDHLRDEGGDLIVFADGTWSGFDLTQPSKLIYPCYPRRRR